MCELNFVQETCIECGTVFQVLSAFCTARKRDHKSFYCPNGHSQYYIVESKAERLERQFIKTIPNDELKRDLSDSYEDIAVCAKALKIGVTQYSGGSVQKRLDGNRGFIRVIEAEIERRTEGGG